MGRRAWALLLALAGAAMPPLGAQWTAGPRPAMQAAAPEEQDLAAAHARALALRRIELTLATGRVPREDRYLAHPRGVELTGPRLFEALLARSASFVLASYEGEEALRGIDARELERFVRSAERLLALAAALGAFAAAFALTRGRPALLAGLAASGCFLLLPVLAGLREAPLGIGSFEALLAFLQIALAAAILRARQPADRWMGGLALAIAAGVAALGSAGGALLPLSLLACFAAWSFRDPRLRAPAMLMALVMAIVFVLCGGFPLSKGAAWEPVERLWSFDRAWWRLGVVLLALYVLLAERARKESVMLSVVSVAALLAAALDARCAYLLDALGCVVLPAACAAALTALSSAAPGPAASSPSRAAGALCIALACVVLLPPLLATDADYEPRQGSDLRFLRTATPSPGPWNHPEAPQEFAVLTLPSYGGLVAHEGRRPVLAVASAGPLDANEREVWLLLLQHDPQAFRAAARARGVRFVALTPGMERDERLAALLRTDRDLPRLKGSMLQRLVEASMEENLPVGLARVQPEWTGSWKLFELTTP